MSKTKDSKLEWALIEQMTQGVFTEDAVDPKEKEIQIQAYMKKRDEFSKKFKHAQNMGNESQMHMYRERLKEVEAKLRALGAV